MSLKPAFKSLVEQEIRRYANQYSQHKAEIISALTSYALPPSLTTSIHKSRKRHLNTEYLQIVEDVWSSQRASDKIQLGDLSIEEAKNVLPVQIGRLELMVCSKLSQIAHIESLRDAWIINFHTGSDPSGPNMYSFHLTRETIIADMSSFDSDLRSELHPYLSRAFYYHWDLSVYFINDRSMLELLQRKMYWADKVQKFRDNNEIGILSTELHRLQSDLEEKQDIYKRVMLDSNACARAKIELLDKGHAQRAESGRVAILHKYGSEKYDSQDTEMMVRLFGAQILPVIDNDSDYEFAAKEFRRVQAKISCLNSHQGELLAELDRVIPRIKPHGPAIFSSKKIIRKNLEALRDRMAKVVVSKDTDYEAFEKELDGWKCDVKMDLEVSGPFALLIKLIRSSGPTRTKEVYEDLVDSSKACPSPYVNLASENKILLS
ncbi:hypothetical protein [Legionella sp. W05-934-2]|uniref:hypothetical protein n=1 Tax=Legionella sp. W05-934-2 TaxID=1198649 RepID=UPI0034633AD7